MKAFMKRAIKEETGAALALALVLLVVGGLILTPLLGLMSTGLVTGQIYERKTDELYGADAGVEDAVWKIQNQVDEVYYLYCGGGDNSWSYNITDVNGKSVDVTITYVSNVTHTYRVESIATSDGSGTRVEAYITSDVIYRSILDHLIVVKDNLDEGEIAALQGDLDKLDIQCPDTCTECDKCGQVYDYNSDAYENIPAGCRGCIAVYNFPDAGWPTVSDLSDRYWEDVSNETAYGSGTIDVNGDTVPKGPMYRDGTLEIFNNHNKKLGTLSLTGTLYITGDTEMGMDGGGKNKPNLTIELNGNTIFVASSSTGSGHEALAIGPWCTINGPGAIVAVGDVYFQPNGETGVNQEPAFVISVNGTTRIQPGVNFLGAIAGKLDVGIQSGDPDVAYPPLGFGPLNFPSIFEAKRSCSIYSWEVYPI